MEALIEEETLTANASLPWQNLDEASAVAGAH